MKAFQMRDNGVGPAQAGWALRDISPRLLLGNFRGHVDKSELMERWDAHGAELRMHITNAYLEAFLDVVDPWGPYSDAERCGGATTAGDPVAALEACRSETNVRATWWKISPGDYSVSLDDAFKATLSVVPASTLGRSEIVMQYGVLPSSLPGQEFSNGKLEAADDIYCAVATLANLNGADQTQLCRLIDWGELQWPGHAAAPNDWSDWRALLACP